MDIYTLAAVSLTTRADHKRRPVVGAGQVARTLTLVVSLATVLVLMAHQQHAVARPADLPVAQSDAR